MHHSFLKKLMAIPRIRINLTLKELLEFIFRCFSRKEEKASEALIEKFERNFSVGYGFERGLAVSKARVALFLLLRSLPLKKGGEVIISALHIADFVNMIRLAGFVPVVVDLQDDRYCVDYDDLERKINERTALFVVTHLSGYATDMERVVQISKKFNVPFIEDCSQVVKSCFGGERLGTFGMASIFSMSLAKSVCTLFGGMILCKDDRLLEAIRREAKQFSAPSRVLLVLEAVKNLVLKTATANVIFCWLTFPLIVSMSRVGDVFSRYQKANKTVQLREEMPTQFLTRFCWQQAIMGLSQLATLDERERRRADAGNYLYAKLSLKERVSLPQMEPQSKNTFWLFPVVAEDVADLKSFLLSHGIDSSGMLLSCLADEEAFAKLQFIAPKAMQLRGNTLFLPMYWNISQVELDRIVDAMEAYQSKEERT
jgi:dTDP-4-amino-4,6-dideoxygalactose transaminase